MNDIPDLLQHPDDPKVWEAPDYTIWKRFQENEKIFQMRDNLFVEFAKHLIGIPKYTLAALIFKVLKETGGFMTAASRKLHGEKLSILRKELLVRNNFLHGHFIFYWLNFLPPFRIYWELMVYWFFQRFIAQHSSIMNLTQICPEWCTQCFSMW